MRNMIIVCAAALLTAFSVGSTAQAADGFSIQVFRDNGWHHHHHHHHWDRSWHRYWHRGYYHHHHHRRCYVHRYVTYRFGERVVHVNRYCR